MTEAEDGFPDWLAGLVSKFSGLSSDQQTLTLNQLIACCGSEQLWHLQQRLPDFLYRDFVSLLPPELTERIMSLLPARDLLACCLVSRLWRDRLTGSAPLWLQLARRLGCCVLPDLEQDWRAATVAGLRLRRRLDRGAAWSQVLTFVKYISNKSPLHLQDGLVNLVRPPGRFSALDYHQDHIAGGTADSSPGQEENSETVVVWSVATQRVCLSFQVKLSVSVGTDIH